MFSRSIFPHERVTVVGVLNATPDSFSDGGRFVSGRGAIDVSALVDAGRALARAGAHVLDVGGESTRPGAEDVADAVEIARTAPAIEALAEAVDVPISIDTRKAPVARAALAAGARIVNDVSGGQHDPELAAVAAAAGAPLVLGHIRGTPATMQRAPRYEDVLSEVAAELEAAVHRAVDAGAPESLLAVDPGIGFGKRATDNLQLLAHAGWLRDRLGLPLVVGASRKAFLGAITGESAPERDLASHAAAAVAAFAGADAVRVHDVAGASRAVAVGRAIRDARRKDLA